MSESYHVLYDRHSYIFTCSGGAWWGGPRRAFGFWLAGAGLAAVSMTSKRNTHVAHTLKNQQSMHSL